MERGKQVPTDDKGKAKWPVSATRGSQEKLECWGASSQEGTAESKTQINQRQRGWGKQTKGVKRGRKKKGGEHSEKANKITYSQSRHTTLQSKGCEELRETQIPSKKSPSSTRLGFESQRCKAEEGALT